MRRNLVRFGILAFLAAVHFSGMELFDRAQRGVVTRRVLEFALPLDGSVAKRYENPETIRIAKVIVAGPFSGWNPDDEHYRMEQVAPGRWRFEMTFAPGHNQYKFVLHLGAPLRQRTTREKHNPVWAHDPHAALNVSDGFDGFNSVVIISDHRQAAAMFRFASLGLLFAAALLLILAPAVRWLMRRHLPFRHKLVLAVVAFGLLGNGVFIVYNRHATDAWCRIAALDAVGYMHGFLLAGGIRPGTLTDPAVAARARRLLFTLMTNTATRSELSKTPNNGITLTTFEILDRKLAPQAWGLSFEWQVAEAASRSGYTNQDRFYTDILRRVPGAIPLAAGNALRTRSAEDRRHFDSLYRINPAGNEWWLHPHITPADLKRLPPGFDLGQETMQSWSRHLLAQLERPGLSGGTYVWLQGTLLVPIIHQHRHHGYYHAQFHNAVYTEEGRRVLEFNLYLLAVCAGMLFLLLRAVGLQVTAQLVTLTDWTKSVAGGDFSVVKTVRTGDEIEVLAGNFDKMRLALAADVERLESLNRLKDEFLANTSHELRTPLVGIIGLAEAMQDGAQGPVTAGQRRTLGMMISSGLRLSSLVNDILDFSKLRDHTLDLRRRAVDIRAVAEAVLAVSQSIVGSKPLKLVNSVPADLPPAHADEDRLSQILFNLVGNAIKFTAAGEVRVGAHSEGTLLAVTVSDTGIGIPADKHDRIFMAFEQADGSTAREYGGTGLGLSVTKSLVELHGGTISVESRAGEGSTFTFTLPVASADNGADAVGTVPVDVRIAPRAATEYTPDAALAASSTLRPDTADNEHMRILVVDDEPVNLEVLTSQLRLERYTVDQAADGAAALALLDSDARFDLVLLDVMMPRLSGYEVCRLLREKRDAYDLPVLMLTAKNRVDDVVAGFESGANDYLTKPFDKRELLSRVKTLTTLRRAVAEHNQYQLLKQELDVARRIQQSILPKHLPVLPGLAVAARYLPMAEVGGDFYDFSPAGTDKLGVLVADVSGHGVPAALVAAMVKLAYGQQGGFVGMPDRVLVGLNADLAGKLDKSYLTAGCLFVDPGARRLLYASAGHPPLLVVKRRAGRIVPHKPAGRILGWFDDPAPALAEAGLESGDRIVLYTDGITEAFSPLDEEWGDDRFAAFLLETADRNVADCADALVTALRAWTGKADAFDDDVTLVIVDVD